MITLEIVRFAAIECKLQQSGELSVYSFCNGYNYAQDRYERGVLKPTLDDVLKIAAFIEPKENHDGFRRVDVRVGWDVKLPWNDVPEFMNALWEDFKEGKLSNEELIYQSLGIAHSFRDGNGRTHQILWNWLEGTLDHPTWHKDFWSDPRRTVGYGA